MRVGAKEGSVYKLNFPGFFNTFLTYSIVNMILPLILFLLYILSQGQITTKPMVCLKTACFAGSWIFTNRGVKYASFQGIRYAEAPVGKLRFKPPKVRIRLLTGQISKQRYKLLFYNKNHYL